MNSEKKIATRDIKNGLKLAIIGTIVLSIYVSFGATPVGPGGLFPFWPFAWLPMLMFGLLGGWLSNLGLFPPTIILLILAGILVLIILL